MVKTTAYDDMIGKVFGRLFITSFASPKINVNKGVTRFIPYFIAKCSCGKDIVVHAGHVKSGHTTSCGCYRVEYIQGENNPTYNPNLTDKDRKKWRVSQIARWSKEVRKRDGSCVVCGATKKLVAHHLNNYANNEESRLDINNGVTMCRACHTDFHVNFMGNYRTPCTEEDFNEYLLQV